MKAAEEQIELARITIAEEQKKSFRHLRSQGVRKKALDEFEAFLQSPGTLARPSLIVRLLLRNGTYRYRVVVDKPLSQWRLTECFSPFLETIVALIPMPIDCFVLVSDNVYVHVGKRTEFQEFLRRIPFLRCDRRDGDELSEDSILIPDFSLQAPGYAEEQIAVTEAAARLPFAARTAVAKWRGRLSGPGYPVIASLNSFPRFILVKMSLDHPELIDARLTTFETGGDVPSASLLKDHLRHLQGEPSSYIPAAGFVSYKYLLSLDGAVSAWKRVPLILASGSVLLLQAEWQQFFYPAMKPWVHYIPLSRDLSDVLPRINWLNSHPAETEEIAIAGSYIAEACLKANEIRSTFLDVMRQCGELH